ncbi:MAG TPA: response regulator [Elusimicrobiales bacterium]|nr:response regulator [Elusimicrobiales bacterium]
MLNEKKRILVVDDDPAIRDFVCTVLSLDYETMEAEDGMEAWQKVLSWRPHVVVTDLMMPRMHGYELCSRLKGPEAPAGVKVVVISAKTFETDKAHAFAAGADSYVTKPFSVPELREKVQELLSAAAPAGQVERRALDKGGAIHSSELPVPASASAGSLPVYVRFWGTRGSCPTSNPMTARYGGNTACTEVRVGNTLIIIDCGSGLRELGGALTREYAGKPIDGHIFVGHTHWDHIQGFPFFTPLYNPNNSFRVYSVHGASSSLQKIFSESMAKDYFPVPLSKLGSRLSFVELGGPVDLGAAKISFHHLNHPGPCIAFRIEAQGKVIVYLSDHEEFHRLSGDSEASRRQEEALADFARGSDLLIREAQYTEAEYATRKGWGHATFDDAARFAAGLAAPRMAIFHHDPDRSDDDLDAAVEHTRGLLKSLGAATECFAARDGQRVDL